MSISGQTLGINEVKRTKTATGFEVLKKASVNKAEVITAGSASENSSELDSRLAAIQAVSEYVRTYLKTHKRKISWLAAQSGVHRMTISRIIHQDTLADPATCRALAQVMEVPQEKLLVLAGYLEGSVEPENKGFTIPALDDPELGFYLCQIGELDIKTREVVKSILKEDYERRQKLLQIGQAQEGKRPPFARPV